MRFPYGTPQKNSSSQNTHNTPFRKPYNNTSISSHFTISVCPHNSDRTAQHTLPLREFHSESSHKKTPEHITRIYSELHKEHQEESSQQMKPERRIISSAFPLHHISCSRSFQKKTLHTLSPILLSTLVSQISSRPHFRTPISFTTCTRYHSVHNDIPNIVKQEFVRDKERSISE